MSRVTLNSNSAALTAQRRLGESTSALGGSFERLASGLRINRASDDAAGLAIAAGLNVDARVFAQGVRNINDGISYLNVAEAATVELKGILLRMRELATQSSNGTLGDAQRQALDEEAQALVGEYNRIVDITAYNGTRVFDPDNVMLNVQAGYAANGTLKMFLGETVTRVMGNGLFHPKITYDGGDGAYSVALGDLNGDGILDLVTVSRFDNKANVLLGNGDGTFQPKVPFDGGVDPRSITVADVNGDGRPDLVTASNGDSKVNVLLGNGDGTFQPKVPYDGGIFVTSATVADVNGDNVLDLLSTSGIDNTVSVLLGNGDGTFQSKMSYGGGSGLRSVAVADLDGDGNLDLITASNNDNKVNVLLGNGDGTFQPRVSFDGGGGAWSIAVADLNGDGKLDLVTASQNDNKVNVLLGNGDGTFLAKVSYDGGDRPRSVAVADFDGDGHLDLVSASQDDDSVNILLGNGDGTFQPKFSFDGGDGAQSVAVADVSGDGVFDLVIASPNDDKVNVLIGDTAITTTTVYIERIGSLSIGSLSAALAAQSALDGYLDTVSKVSGLIGASQSRLEAAAETLRVTLENYRAAESRIVDADIAEESANLVRNQILQQAGAAVLGQANQLPSLALKLLQA